MFDASGAETTETANVTSLLYTIRVDKRLAGFSATTVQATPDSDRNNEKTNARITVTPPSRGIPSSLPFSGHFTVSCTDFDGNRYTSYPIEYDDHYTTIEKYI